MVNILLIDDGNEKILGISGILKELKLKYSFGHQTNIVEARKLMRSNYFDIAIVDLNIKNDAISTAKIESGLDLLNLILADKKCNLPKEIFFLTELDDINNELKLSVANSGSKLFYYKNDYSEWTNYLISRINFYNEFNKRNHIDILFITALEEEYRSILNINSIDWGNTNRDNNYTSCLGQYYSQKDDTYFKCLAISPFKKGMSSIAALTSLILACYKPRVAFLTGICAGTDKIKQQFGDTLVSEFIWDYHSGKITESGFHGAPFQTKATADILDVIRNLYFNNENVHHSYLEKKILDLSLGSRWSIQFGPTVSGGAVIADSSKVTEISTQHKDIIGIDMEGYGFYEALQFFPKTSGCFIKSISDFGDSDKNDAYRDLALSATNQVLTNILSSESFLELFF